MPGLTSESAVSALSDLEWYNASSLRTMLRWRSDRWREVRAKSDLIAALRACILDASSIHAALAGANAIEHEALALLKRKGGAMPVAAMSGQIAVWHPDLPPARVRAVPSELVRRALAFWRPTVTQYGRATVHDVQRPATDNVHSVMIFSPAEILDQVTGAPNPPAAYLTPTGPVATPSSPTRWQQRLLRFLRAIEERPPRILQSGLIGSRDRTALVVATGLSDDVPGAPRLSPVNFYRLILGAAGLLEVSGERQLRTTPEALRFVSLPPAQQTRTLLETWIESGENELLALGHLHCERHANVPRVAPEPGRISRARRLLIEVLREQARPGQSYDLAALSSVVRSRDVEFLVSWLDPVPYRWSGYGYLADRDQLTFPPYPGVTLEDARGRSRAPVMGEDWDLVEGAFIRAVFQGPLTWLGVVECRADHAGKVAFAITPLGAQALELEGGVEVPDLEEIPSHADALIVQPNFEIVVYAPDDRLELLYHIDRFAERVSVDRLAIYRLTNESVCNGLQLGLRIDDVIGLLAGAAQVPLPQNVTFTLRDWARRFEEIHWIRNAWLIEAPDPATLARWLSEPSVQAAVERQLSPTIALCRGTCPPDLPDRLAALGPDVAVIDGNAPLVPCGRADGYGGLWIPARDQHHYLQHAVGSFAELLGADGRGSRYQITPESISRALRSGASAARILDLIEQITLGLVPAGLRVRVNGWAGAYGAIAVGTVGIFVAPSPEAFQELRGDPLLACHFIQPISSTAAIVDLDALDVLRRALAERGIQTRKYNSKSNG